MTPDCQPARLDAALDREASPEEHAWADAHVRSCVECAARARQRAQTDVALGALPRELTPPRELWPELAVRIEAASAAISPRPRIASVVLQLAASLLLLAAGYTIGVQRARVTSVPVASMPALRSGPASVDHADATGAAQDIQRTGSAFTASLARLSAHGGDSISAQEREVAIASLRGAMMELTRISPQQALFVAAYHALRDEQQRIGLAAQGRQHVNF